MLPEKQKPTLWHSQFSIDGPSLTCCYAAIFGRMMMKLQITVLETTYNNSVCVFVPRQLPMAWFLILNYKLLLLKK